MDKFTLTANKILNDKVENLKKIKKKEIKKEDQEALTKKDPLVQTMQTVRALGIDPKGGGIIKSGERKLQGKLGNLYAQLAKKVDNVAKKIK